jgi:hypothetical protein
MPAGLFSNVIAAATSPGKAMSGTIHLIAAACLIFGGVGLVASFLSEESDGSKLIAQAVRAVGFLLLAGALNGYS